MIEQLISFGGVGEEYSVHFPLARNWSSGERMPGAFLLEYASEGTCTTKALHWTSCHLGPSCFTVGSNSGTKLITDPLGVAFGLWGHEWNYGQGQCCGLNWSPWGHILEKNMESCVPSLWPEWVGLGVARWINSFFPALPSVHFWVMPDGVVQKFEILGTKINGQNKCSEERVSIVRHTKSQE